jgi:hypothetical protein
LNKMGISAFPPQNEGHHKSAVPRELEEHLAILFTRLDCCWFSFSPIRIH